MSEPFTELIDEIATRHLTVQFTVAQAVAVVIAGEQLSPLVHNVDLTGGLAAIIASLEKDRDAFHEESMLETVSEIIH